MRTLGLICIFVGVVGLTVYVTGRVVSNIQFTRDIEGHLKRASDANQPALALEEINLALEGMTANGVCNPDDPCSPGNCYTSILYRTPDEDVCFWRTNIEQTAEDLEALPPDADHLVVSNTLMKVRETLVDEGASVAVTVPEGISIYPNNKVYFWLLLFLPIVLLCVGFDVWLRGKTGESTFQLFRDMLDNG